MNLLIIKVCTRIPSLFLSWDHLSSLYLCISSFELYLSSLHFRVRFSRVEIMNKHFQKIAKLVIFRLDFNIYLFLHSVIYWFVFGLVTSRFLFHLRINRRRCNALSCDVRETSRYLFFLYKKNIPTYRGKMLRKWNDRIIVMSSCQGIFCGKEIK